MNVENRKQRVDKLKSDAINVVGDICLFDYGLNTAGIADIGYPTQHLYFTRADLTSEQYDDTIEPYDWVLMFDNIGHMFCDKPKQYIPENGHVLNKGLRRINVTTDRNVVKMGIPIPKPSNSFIQKYVAEHRKGNTIKEVLLDYEYAGTACTCKGSEPCVFKYYDGMDECCAKKVNGEFFLKKIKTAPDNTVTIHPVEPSWDEIMKILSNQDVSWGTKEAMIREKYNAPTLKN